MTLDMLEVSKKESNSLSFDIEALTQGSTHLRISSIMDTDIRELITQLLLVHVLRDVKPNVMVRNICSKLCVFMNLRIEE